MLVLIGRTIPDLSRMSLSREEKNCMDHEGANIALSRKCLELTGKVVHEL